MKKGKVCWLSLFGGLVFALCSIIGAIYAPAGNTPASITGEAIRTSIPALLLLTLIYGIILYRLFIRDYAVPDARETSAALIRRRPFLISFAAILLAWLPYLLICYPGNITFDGARQLRQALGMEPLTNQHPVLGTFLLGFLFRIGGRVSDNVGLFTVVIVQSLLTALIAAGCEKKVLELTGSTWVWLMTLLWFALNPIWGLFEQTVVKDIPFTALFMLYTLCYVEAAAQVLDRSAEGTLDWKKSVGLVTSGVLCCMIRHGETIVVAISLLLLAALALRERRKTLLLAILTIAMAVGGSKTLVAVTHAGSAPTRATFSVFFQQTALYMKKYPQDVTPEQYAAIDAVLDAENIGALYNPFISDPVKGTYKENVGRKELAAYFKAWFQMLFRHPRTYVDSFLQFAYSYVDPFHCAVEKRTFYIAFKSYKGADHLVYPRAKTLRKAFRNFTRRLTETPVVQQLIYPGIYFWISAACFLLLWHKGRYQQMAVYSLPFLRVAMCLASPVAGYLRYTLPLLGITPLMIAWACANAAAADRSGNKDSLR